MTSPAPGNNPLSRVISPAPGAAPALDIPAAPEGDAFPCTLTCHITQAPPECGVYFRISDTRGVHSPQVFEHAAIYRYISITGMYGAYRQVRHPLTDGVINRQDALDCVVDVPADVQARITRERVLLRLPPADPLTDDNPCRYEEMLEKMADPTRQPCEIGYDEDGRLEEGNREMNSFEIDDSEVEMTVM